MASHSKNFLHNGALPVIVAGVLILTVFFLKTIVHDARVLRSDSQEDPMREVAPPVTIVLVGDIMFDRGVEMSIQKNFSGDYEALFGNTTYLRKADIAFANLEGPVATSGRNVGSRFSFRMDPAGLDAMKKAGFDIVSFANNHVGDYTLEAFKETLDRLSGLGIQYTGAGHDKNEAINPAIISAGGLNIGFLGATDVGPEWYEAKEIEAGVVLASDPNLTRYIADAKKKVDILVVSFHWGNEYSPANAHQEALAHAAIDAGADIVVGHHPHVMQKMERYKEKLIFYSLGNFIFDQYFSSYTMEGMVARVLIDPHTKALTASLSISPLNRSYIPQPLVVFEESRLVTKPFTP